MTKEELKANVDKQQSIINDANHEIYSCVNDYIESLPYKLGDKVSCRRCDGTRSNREFVLYYGEIDSIKKIN